MEFEINFIVEPRGGPRDDSMKHYATKALPKMMEGVKG